MRAKFKYDEPDDDLYDKTMRNTIKWFAYLCLLIVAGTVIAVLIIGKI